jgi:hypothetical protein
MKNPSDLAKIELGIKWIIIANDTFMSIEFIFMFEYFIFNMQQRWILAVKKRYIINFNSYTIIIIISQ